MFVILFPKEVCTAQKVLKSSGSAREEAVTFADARPPHLRRLQRGVGGPHPAPSPLARLSPGLASPLGSVP
uniref:Uncharacterized protein n=1 Tax=Rangifer tarandus platyrhynchus TaxID=3082113 RepID=A0ACB0DYA8_RANTA|nr:unnamed protein product [Rangifer tarandus platyrhynchus]